MKIFNKKIMIKNYDNGERHEHKTQTQLSISYDTARPVGLPKPNACGAAALPERNARL